MPSARQAAARRDGLVKADERAPSSPSDSASSRGVTVAVPRFITTTPPATLASQAASAGAAPAASATVNALMTVSPAPVTSAISSLP